MSKGSEKPTQSKEVETQAHAPKLGGDGGGGGSGSGGGGRRRRWRRRLSAFLHHSKLFSGK